MTDYRAVPQKVTVRKLYLMHDNKRIPYKWKAECSCGWTGMSWAWVRAYEDNDYEPVSNESMIASGGAFVLAIEHRLWKQAS